MDESARRHCVTLVLAAMQVPKIGCRALAQAAMQARFHADRHAKALIHCNGTRKLGLLIAGLFCVERHLQQ